MIANVNSKPKGFKPVTLEIILESQEEVDQFHNIFNCSFILDATIPDGSKDRVIDGGEVRDALEYHVENDLFAQDDIWRKFFYKLQDKFE